MVIVRVAISVLCVEMVIAYVVVKAVVSEAVSKLEGGVMLTPTETYSVVSFVKFGTISGPIA